MADEFFLDESQFRGVTSDIRSTGSKLQAAHRTLNDTLGQFQGCWGDDDIGKAFEGNYWANAEKVRIGLAEAGPGLVTTGDNVQKKADQLADVDDETADWLDKQVPQD